MNDYIKPRLFEDSSERVAVAYVGLVQFEVFAREVRRDVAALDGGVVEVVEVVNDLYAPAALTEQTPDQMRADEPRAARDENVSHKQFSVFSLSPHATPLARRR